MQHYQQGQGEVSHYPHHQARQEQGDLELEATYITVQNEAPQRILKLKINSVFSNHILRQILKKSSVVNSLLYCLVQNLPLPEILSPDTISVLT